MEAVGLNNQSSSFVEKRVAQGRLASLFFVAFVPMGCFYALRELRVSQLVSGTAALTIAGISGVALRPKKGQAPPSPKKDSTPDRAQTPPPLDDSVHELPPWGPEGLAAMADPEKEQVVSESYRIAVLEQIESAMRGGTVNHQALEQILRDIEANCSNLPYEKEQEKWRRIKQSIEVILGEIDALALERQIINGRLGAASERAGQFLEQAQDLMVIPGLTLGAIGELEGEVTAFTSQPLDLPPDNVTGSIGERERQFLENCRQLTSIIDMLKTDLRSRDEDRAARVAQQADEEHLDVVQVTYGLEYWRVPDDGDCLFHAATGALGAPSNPKALRTQIATRIRQLFAPEAPETPFRIWVEERINDFVQETAASENKPRGCPQAYYDLLRVGEAGGWQGYCTYLEMGQGELPTLLFGGEVEAAFLAEILGRPIVIHHRIQTQIYLRDHGPCEGNYDAISALTNPLHLFHAGGVHYNYFTPQTSEAASSS